METLEIKSILRKDNTSDNIPLYEVVFNNKQNLHIIPAVMYVEGKHKPVILDQTEQPLPSDLSNLILNNSDIKKIIYDIYIHMYTHLLSILDDSVFIENKEVIAQRLKDLDTVAKDIKGDLEEC